MHRYTKRLILSLLLAVIQSWGGVADPTGAAEVESTLKQQHKRSSTPPIAAPKAVTATDQHCSSSGSKHPVVFIPGVAGSVLRGSIDIPADVALPNKHCVRHLPVNTLMWIDPARIFLPHEIECLFFYMRLQFNSTSGTMERPQWAKTIDTVDFGGLGGLEYLDPTGLLHTFTGYFHKMLNTLKSLGFKEGVHLFGAPYDWRFTPAANDWTNRTKTLVEKAYYLNNGTKVDLVSHSMGAPFTYYMLMQQTPQWRHKFVGKWVPIAPVWIGTPLAALAQISGYFFDIPFMPTRLSSTFYEAIQSLFFLLPNHNFFGSQPITTSPSAAYTALSFPKLLQDRRNVSWAVKMSLESAALLGQYQLDWPEGIEGVECAIGYGEKTVESFHYEKDADIGLKHPSVAHGDGDGTVILKSSAYACEKWKDMKKPATVSTRKMGHLTSLMDDHVITTVVNTVC